MQQFPALVLTLGFDVMAEHELGSGLMHARIELEAATVVGLVDRPSSEDLCGFCDVTLRVAAVHAERVQLEEFAAVVFVQAAVLLFLCIRILSRTPRRITIGAAGAGTRRNADCL